VKSVSKVLGLFLVGLLLLIVAAGFAITHLFDPNDYKDEIRQLVRDKAELELHLNGEIGWSLFPWLGLEVTDVKVAQLATPEQPFADVRLLALSVRVMPLLRKEIQMSDIRVDGLSLDLHRDKKGLSNWEPKPAKNETASNKTEQIEKTSEETSAANSNIKLDIDSLIVNSARIDYKDEQAKQHLTLENVQITTGAISANQDIALKISGFIANAEPLIRARMEMTALASLDFELQRYQVKDLKMSGEFAGEPLNGKSANFSVRGNVLLDQSAQVAVVDQLKLSLNQFKSLADLRIEQLDKEPQIQGNLSVAAVNLKEFLPSVGIELPETQNPKALTSFEFSSAIKGTSQAISFNEANIKLDQTSFTGSFGSKNLAKGAVFAVLDGDKINLDDYLPPSTEPVTSAASTAKKGSGTGNNPLPPTPTENPWSTDKVLPLADLRGLNLDTQLTLKEALFNKLPLRNLKINAQANQGMLSLKEFSANLYDGSISSSATVNAKTDNPQITLNADVKNVPAEKILAALEQDALLEGKIIFAGKFTTQGNSEKAWIANLNGTSNFKVSDGKLTTINADQYLCTAIATLNRKQLTQNFTGNSTNFNALNGSVSIKNGLANNPDLTISMPGLNVAGKGSLDLNLLGLDYKIGATLLGDSREMPDPACAINERYVGLELPIRCRGPLTGDAPNCQLDQDGLGKIAAKLAGEKLTEKLSDKLDKKLGDKASPELKDALKGLFR